MTTLIGPRGEARQVPPERLDPIRVGAVAATLDYWWLHLPGQSLLVVHAGNEPSDVVDVEALEVLIPPPGEGMDTFALGLITLDDLPGVPPANRRWPWVTHELLVQTIDTSSKPVPFDAPVPWIVMSPHNLSIQFQADNDDQARAVTADVAQAIVNGLLPAEVQAYVPERGKMMTLLPLHVLWQDTVTATAEHHRTGGAHNEAPDR